MRSVTFLVVGLWVLAPVGLAQEAPLNKTITVDYRNAPVAEVLKDLAGKAGVRIAVAADLVQNLDNVTYAAKDTEAGRVLTRILRPRGLNIRQADDGSVSVFKLDKFDEFKIKREEVYEFASKPKVTREGDRITIAFETKAFCDVTIAIENEQGRIVRHLASGVLGDNAPEPFQWNSKKQVVVWDGKNDKGEYIDDKDSITVRVSLGLKPQFERTLFWSPYKRTSEMPPLLAATEEGVLACEGWGTDHVRMYDHDGRYLRTVYPFPTEKLKQVRGLEWEELPYGQRVPVKKSAVYGNTLLTSGDSALAWHTVAMGHPGTGMGIRGKNVALVGRRLNRFTTDGASWGAGIQGSNTGVEITTYRFNELDRTTVHVGPTSVAIAPDGKWIYLAGFSALLAAERDTLHGVARIPADGTGPQEVFLGSLKFREGLGTEPGKFRNATSVDCDSKGRVYVADFMNDRVQVFSPDGTYLKSISVSKPAVVRVHRRNDEIYVFSWLVPSRPLLEMKEPTAIAPLLTRFGPFDNPKPLARFALPLPLLRYNLRGLLYGIFTTAEIDSWTEPPTVWLARESRNDGQLRGVAGGDGGQFAVWENNGIRLLREKDGKLQAIKDFGQETVRQVVRAAPPVNAIQRLAVNPVTGKLYVGEADSAPTAKNFCSLVELDPETGKTKIVELPFNPNEYAFDIDGNIYLRSTDMIARYSFPSLREIPWDYGTERARLGQDGGIGGRATSVSGGLELPAKAPVCFHQGGIGVSPKGYVVASCPPTFARTEGRRSAFGPLYLPQIKDSGGRPYQPAIYPGRSDPGGLTPSIHIWDKHGKVVYEDVVPGVSQLDGVELDKDLNLYFMQAPTRLLDGKPYRNNTHTETLMKMRPGKGKIYSSKAVIPMAEGDRPRRAPDLRRPAVEGDQWVSGAQWYYGGVGFGPFNTMNCNCWFSRFALDYFARSIAPEPFLFSVAVVDSNGNLILRMGRCGNVDDGMPLIKDGGPPNPRSIGGDEVSLFYACYVATHTDRRIFISDVGNARLVSVKLGYYTEEKVALKDVKDEGKH